MICTRFSRVVKVSDASQRFPAVFLKGKRLRALFYPTTLLLAALAPAPVFAAESPAYTLPPPEAPLLLELSPQPVPASSAEVEAANPIKLRIVKGAPSSELSEISGAFGMNDCVQTGIKNNLSLKEQEQIWIGSKFLARAALSKFGPSASFNTMYSASSLNQMLFFPVENNVAASPMQPIVKGSSLSLIFAGVQPVFTGGRLLGGYKAARAQERQSLSELRELRISTALKIKEAYWSAALAQARLKVDTDYVKYREWSASNLKARAAQGKSTRADYLREDTELAKARVKLNESYRDFNSALLNLKAVMAVNLGSNLSLKDGLDFVEVAGDAGTYLLEAAKNRPEIQRAESRLQEAKARKMVAMSKYSPQINAYGLGSNISGSSPDGNAAGRWGGFIGVMGGVTLFDSGSRLNELRAANAAVRQAEIARRDAELKVAQEVSQAWIDLDLARRNVELARDQLKSAEEDHRLFHARHQVGKSIALEDFDAGVRLFQSRLTLLESIYQFRIAQSRLLFASGSV